MVPICPECATGTCSSRRVPDSVDVELVLGTIALAGPWGLALDKIEKSMPSSFTLNSFAEVVRGLMSKGLVTLGSGDYLMIP